MIAGEIEHLYIDPNDSFLNFGKKEKKTLTDKQREERSQKRANTLQDIGSQFKEGGLVNGLMNMFGAKPAPVAEDYTIGVNHTPSPTPAPVKKGIPMGILAIGGIALVGIAAFIISQKKKNEVSAPVAL